MSTAQPLHLAIAATFTAEPISDALDFWLRLTQPAHTLHFAPFNQIFQQLLDARSTLRSNQGINVLLLRFDDWLRNASTEGSLRPDAASATRVREHLAELHEALTAASQQGMAECIVCLCPPAPFLRTGQDFSFDALESEFSARLGSITGVSVITASETARLYPQDDYYDFHADKLGNIPYKPIYFDCLASMIMRRVVQLRTAPAKVLILDCDNTLWGGVCGEDGPAGLRLAERHLQLQRRALQAHAQGMLLCLCSKNNETDVWQAFDALPGMLLKREHFVDNRINWHSKAGNIASLAATLQLSPASFIFIDDNPLECAEVTARFPEVLSLCLPADDADAIACLDHIWPLDTRAITREDQQRTQHYRENVARAQFQSSTRSFEDFLAGLSMQVDIRPVDAALLPRAAQLSQRVNQFNFTTERLTEQSLASLLQDERHQAFVVDVRDRFGDYGTVGALILRHDTRELKLLNLMLSCRALGKGVEYQMLAFIGAHARSQQLEQVRIELIDSPRNQPARDFLQRIASRDAIQDGTQTFFTLTADFLASLRFEDYLAGAAVSQPGAEALPAENDALTTDAPLPYARIALELNSPQRIHAAILHARQSTRTDHANHLAPRNDIERGVAGIWQEVLELESISITDNFFDLGGESIKAVQILSRIREGFAVDLPMSVLFEERITVESLAQAVEFSLLTNADPAALAEELAAIENMSDEEIERLLQQSGG